MMQKRTRSLSRQIVLLFVLILVASTVTIGTISYFLNRNEAVAMHSDRALGIARSIAASIDARRYQVVLDSSEKTVYWYDLKAYLDRVITENDLVYLYVLYGHDEADVLYYAEGMVSGDTAYEMDLGDRETLDNFDEHILDVFRGQDVVSKDIYSADEWGYMVSGLTPIFDSAGQVIGVVGADVAVNDVLEQANRFGLLILLLVLGITAVFGVAIALYLRRSLGRPIAELTAVAKKIAQGEPDVEIKTESRTEIGVLADSFRNMVATIKEQALTLQSISEGDLSVKVTPKSEHDVMSHAFIETINRLSAMLVQINILTNQVASESGQIASSAQSLARGASSQASAVEQLSSSISEISIQTKQNADMAEASAKLANTMRDDAASSFTQMDQLIEAVNEINKASNAIRYVLKVIDEVAFETNILSLNASVEAARVGDQGRGFAVVSKEIQSLSKKTSDSAKETAALIADTLSKTKLGVELANSAHDAMQKVVQNVMESDRIANEIALSSREQMLAIEQINQGIHQVALVVHQNNAVADESASVSDKMNKQATNLSGLVSRFRTKDE